MKGAADGSDYPFRPPGTRMSSYTRVLLLACAAVLLYDTVLAVAAARFGVDYASPGTLAGSLSIYAAAGFFALGQRNIRLRGLWPWRSARARGRVRAGAVAGSAAGLVDSTLGWLLSVLIGPEHPGGGTNPLAIAAVVVGVTLLGAACGGVGGMFARRR